MSIVIIGGHDRMAAEYKKMCKSYQCKVKVFTQMPGNFRNQIGTPDLFVLFTNTVSHKMINMAVTEAKRQEADVIRCHTSSKSALKEILETVSA